MMHIEKTHLLEALQDCRDPFLGLTAVEMGLKYQFKDLGQTLLLNLEARFPTKLLNQTYLSPLQQHLQSFFPKLQINLTQAIQAHRTQLAGFSLRGVKNTIAIASGKGGVGKSTVAVNLAIALARCGARVGILDADIYGPSIPMMLGKTAPVQCQDEHYLPVQSHGIQAMSIGYLTKGEQALIWRGPMLAKSLLQMLNLTQWDNLDYLLIDLPPGTGDIQLSLVQKIPLTGAIIVTTPQQIATLDAEKAITMFARTGIDRLGIIENMALHQCKQCGHLENIFNQGGAEKLCTRFQLPLLGKLPLDKQIGEDCDKGQPTATEQGPLAETFMKIALQTAMALAERPLNTTNTK